MTMFRGKANSRMIKHFTKSQTQTRRNKQITTKKGGTWHPDFVKRTIGVPKYAQSLGPKGPSHNQMKKGNVNDYEMGIVRAHVA